MSQVQNGLKVSSLLSFGQDINTEATNAIGEANQILQRTTAALESSKSKAKGTLEALDEMRASLYSDSLKDFFSLYDPSLSGLKDIPPNNAQSERFLATSPSFSAATQICEPFPTWKKVGLAVVLGSAWAFILLQILGLIGAQQPAALIATEGALLGLLSAMTFYYRRAKKNLAAAMAFGSQVRDFEESAIRFSSIAEQLAKDITLATEALQSKALGLSEQVESLNDTVAEAANAAMLLTKLIEKPLVDGDNALLADVMQQLEEDAATATNMQNLLGIDDSALRIGMATA